MDPLVASTGVELIELPTKTEEDARTAGTNLSPLEWLSLPAAPSAVVCGSDAAAAAILRECGARGIPVPEQLSVIGLGNTELARHASPGLSTLRIPAHKAAIAAVDYLLAALRGETVVQRPLVTKVVARESTGPASG